MAGKVSLPVTVEIGFGAGPMDATVTWTDVSAYVQRSKTISCNRSIDTTTMTPGDGRGSLRLSNKDGDFTPGATGAFGVVRNRLPIRIRQGATVVWTGLAEKWSAGVDGIRAVVDVTLVDRWPRMRQRVLTGDRIQQVCQALGAVDLWPMTDPTGSTRAENVLGARDLVIATPTSPTLGAATNPQGGSCQPVVTFAAPSALHNNDSAGDTVNSRQATVSLWARVTEDGDAVHFQLNATGGGPAWLDVSLAKSAGDDLRLSGSATASSYASATPALTSQWRHIAVTADATGATGTLRLYLDGIQVGAATWSTGGSWAPSDTSEVGGWGGAEAGYAAVWHRALSASEVAAIAAAGLDALGTTGQAPDARAALAAALWPPTTLTTQGTCAATMSKQAIDGVSQADLLAACAVTEGGMLHIGAGGWPVLTARGARSDAALAATIPASVIETSAQWELDDTQIVNVATVERMALAETASTVSRRSDRSVATYGEVTKTVQGWWDTDAQAVERANTEVTMWADPSPRSKSFTVDLMTASTVISPATLLAVDIGSRILLTGLPSQTPAQTAAGWYVDGIDDQITHEGWKRTFTVTPAIDFWVIDDATFGGLDDWPLG